MLVRKLITSNIFEKIGAIIDIKVGIPYLTDNNDDLIQTSEVATNAKIDTGSFATMISKSILENNLNLKPISSVFIRTISQKGFIASVYLVALWIEDELIHPAYHVLAKPYGRSLIGRDFFSQGFFRYDGNYSQFLYFEVQKKQFEEISYPWWLE